MTPALLVLFAAALLSPVEDPAAKARRAAELVVAGKADEAIPIYKDLVLSFPGDPGILLNLSIAEFKAKRYSDAAAHASAVLKLQPDSLAANLFLGSSYEELGEHALALDPLQKVLARQPRERNARLMLAEALLNLQRYQEADAEFQNLRELAPENPRVWYGLGRVYEALSEKMMQELETSSPDSSYRHALTADFLLKQRRYGSAFTHYRLALEGHVNLPGAHVGLATVYERTGHSSWAETERQRERQAAPDCHNRTPACDFAAQRFRDITQAAGSSTAPEALYWGHKAYAEMAKDAYERLLQLPPGLEAHMYQAKTFDQRGLSGEAAAEWREALKLAPRDVRIETSLAWSLFRAHDFAAALPVVQELLQTQHDSSELNFLFGAILLNLDEPGKAIPPLEASLRIHDDFLPAHVALGRALLQTAKPKLAIPHFQAALETDEDASAHFGLLRAYELSSETSLAAKSKAEYLRALAAVDAKQKLEEGGAITAP